MAQPNITIICVLQLILITLHICYTEQHLVSKQFRIGGRNETANSTTTDALWKGAVLVGIIFGPLVLIFLVMILILCKNKITNFQQSEYPAISSDSIRRIFLSIFFLIFH